MELINRMLTVNCKERADMTEVILCLSAIYSGRPLPPRKIIKSKGGGRSTDAQQRNERVGAFRTDGQGIRESKIEEKKPVEVSFYRHYCLFKFSLPMFIHLTLILMLNWDRRRN